MTARHLVRRAADAKFAVPQPWADVAAGYRRWPVVDEASGAVHTGFGIAELAPGGSIPAHVHSFEESFYVLEGTVVVDTGEGSFALDEGDYGVLPVAAPHAWRNTGEARARWADMQAPQPRLRHHDDTYLCGWIVEPGSTIQPQQVADGGAPRRGAAPLRVDVRDPRTRSFGHIDPANMEPGKQSQDLLAVSASMRTALLVYSGITVKPMVDSDLGALLQTMFMVQYEPDGVAGQHDHPFEETYLILEGATDATFDGERYRLEVGDVAWAGVGCVHSFANAGDGPVRWLETQAPQPPARHSYRFARDWDYLASTVQPPSAGGAATREETR